jgi:hypothetical protein
MRCRQNRESLHLYTHYALIASGCPYYSVCVCMCVCVCVCVKVNNEGKVMRTDPGSYAFSTAGLRPLDCWDRDFESRWGNGCSSLVFVDCCDDSGLCDDMIIHWEESYRFCWCLIVCDLETSTMRWSRPEFLCYVTEMKVKGSRGLWVSSRETNSSGVFEVIRMRFGTKISRVAGVACTANNWEFLKLWFNLIKLSAPQKTQCELWDHLQDTNTLCERYAQFVTMKQWHA